MVICRIHQQQEVQCPTLVIVPSSSILKYGQFSKRANAVGLLEEKTLVYNILSSSGEFFSQVYLHNRQGQVNPGSPSKEWTTLPPLSFTDSGTDRITVPVCFLCMVYPQNRYCRRWGAQKKINPSRSSMKGTGKICFALKILLHCSLRNLTICNIHTRT